MTKLQAGSKGALVTAAQHLLGATVKQATGTFDALTVKAVKAYQKKKKLSQTGTIGSPTWAAILADAPTLRAGEGGNTKAVRALEHLLDLPRDGRYTPEEAERVKTYQAAQGLAADGVVGLNTWRALLGLSDVQPAADSVAAPVFTPGKRPKDYKQGGSPWGGKMYSSTGNKGQTMRSSGCGPTAMANIVATFCDAGVTPWTLAQMYMKKGFRTANSGTAWAAFKWTFQQYPQFSKFVQTASHAAAIAALNQGALIVASMGPGYWTRAGHFITLWQCDGSSMYACDPAGSVRKKQNLADFKGQVKQYFIFWSAKGD